MPNRPVTKAPQTKRVTVETPSIQSVDRSLLILEVVGKSQTPVSLSTLTGFLEIDRSSVFRLANTLKRRGYLANPSSGKEYILGTSVWQLSRNYDWSKMLTTVAHEHLKSLARSTNETAHLAIRERAKGLFVDHVGTSHVIAISGQTGEYVPLYCTSHGKALLADFEERALKVLFDNTPLSRLTRRTITSISDLAQVCKRTRSAGYAIDDEEYMDGVRCIAAPIRDHTGIVVASIGISAPISRFPHDRDKEYGLKVTEISQQISELLGAPAKVAAKAR